MIGVKQVQVVLHHAHSIFEELKQVTKGGDW